MIRKNFRSTLRFLWNHKLYSVTNILGLSIGLAAAVLIYLWILDEMSFDRFHANYKRIYRIVTTLHSPDGDFKATVTPAPLAPVFEESFPEIVESARFMPALTDHKVSYGEKQFYESGIAYADREFFRIFSYPLIRGSAADPFPDLNSCILAQSTAEKLFGDEDPMGKVITLDEKTPLTVTGIMEDIPASSHLHFNTLVNFDLLPSLGWDLHWENITVFAYVLANREVDCRSFQSRIDSLYKQLYRHDTYTFHLQPLSEVHLRSSFDFDIYGHTEPRYQYVRAFIIIGIFILIISGINYINLSTARSTVRAHEVMVRKTFGAGRMQLIRQYLTESFILTLLSYLVAMLIVELALPYFNSFTGKSVSVNYSDPGFAIGMVILVLFIGLLSGGYPAFFLASYLPAGILHGEIKAGPYLFRRILVLSQFSIAILMIICSAVVYQQLNYIHKRDLGLKPERIIFCHVRGNIAGKYPGFRDELLRLPGVTGVTSCTNLPTRSINSTFDIEYEGKDQGGMELVHVTRVDPDYIPVFGIELAEGRNFSWDRPGDASCFIFNQTAIRQMKMDDPIGKRFSLWDEEGQIIGVVKDYNFKSLHKAIEPLCMYMNEDPKLEWYAYIFIKLDGSNMPGTIRKIKSVWAEINPSFPFEYTYLDQEYNDLYKFENRLRTLYSVFAAVSVFLSFLGLFGLSSFMAEKRTREIGIRKAVGAGAWQIVKLFSWEAVKWVLIANLIAWPVAWIYMRHWLNGFAYKTRISPSLFLLSALLVLLIAGITISFRAVKAAGINPAETIRQE